MIKTFGKFKQLRISSYLKVNMIYTPIYSF